MNQNKYEAKFPIEFKKASENAICNEETIQELVDKVIGMLNESKNDNVTVSVSTGNTRVFGEKVNQAEGGGYHITVAENYKEIYIGNEFSNYEEELDRIEEELDSEEDEDFLSTY